MKSRLSLQHVWAILVSEVSYIMHIIMFRIEFNAHKYMETN